MEHERKRKRAKKKASERAGKKRGETGEELFRSLSFSLVLHCLNAWNRLGNKLYLH